MLHPLNMPRDSKPINTTEGRRLISVKRYRLVNEMSGQHKIHAGKMCRLITLSYTLIPGEHCNEFTVAVALEEFLSGYGLYNPRHTLGVSFNDIYPLD